MKKVDFKEIYSKPKIFKTNGFTLTVALQSNAVFKLRVSKDGGCISTSGHETLTEIIQFLKKEYSIEIELLV